MGDIEHLYGLIGYPLSHSFSKQYFTEKFQQEGITDSAYELFEIKTIDELPNKVLEQPNLRGLNVTIPYKQQVMKYVDELDPVAERIGAVNTVRVKKTRKVGFNSDYYGFRDSLLPWLGETAVDQALVLGTGGASKAVVCVLQDLGVGYTYVSRQTSETAISYADLKQKNLGGYPLIINTTPLGMSPQTETHPDLNYQQITSKHFCYDLVYNPAETAFMKLAQARGAKTKNGLEMLHLQAEKSWKFWNNIDD
ncbi:shikimate dehydrogenase family protein [Tunicatimonas pelagia]|uniref:shikimate dehydrogenase family protein n=1 Tax=Tunicatimonas pelagia TaxID=931531 RepID=UPI0026656872|nr:shikimate dehydrogenase [Tunicatimonas pelagia]WKN44104.1 shikimate dehydrogenase [Tunicatimonas pelagia]